MPVSFFGRPSFSDRRPAPDLDRHERTLAVLVGAKALIGRGWLQGGWYVLEAPDGRRRFVGPGSLTRRSFGAVVQACLVGAVVEAARWHSAERGTAGPAIDALWRALVEAGGGRLDSDRGVPSPAARGLEVRDLARWNDHQDRTRDEVLRLLDVTIAHVMGEGSRRDRPPEDGDLQTAASRAGAA
jgi:hypothetical protein